MTTTRRRRPRRPSPHAGPTVVVTATPDRVKGRTVSFVAAAIFLSATVVALIVLGFVLIPVVKVLVSGYRWAVS